MAHEVDLESFKELERDIILRVLYPDQTVQSTEEQRVRKLKAHLQHLRWKGAKSSSQEYKEKCCARCQRALGLLLNRGAVCQGCSHRVCSECRVFLRRTRAWKCTVCFEDRNVKIKTGEWFFEERARKFPTAGRRETAGTKLLQSYRRLRKISVVPPTPPPFSESQCSSSSRLQELGHFRGFNKSVENLFLSVTTQMRRPRVIETLPANYSLNSSKKLKTVIPSNPLSTYNQQLWLTCVVELEPSEETSIQTSFTMTVKVDGVSQDGTTTYIHNKVHNRTRTLTCAGKCAEIIVAHLGYLNYTQYRVTVGFEHLNQPIKDMTFTWKTYNPAFSRLEIWFRFVFVVLTFIVICLFVHSLRKFSMRDWGIEQKWMSVLLALLLLYNDPFFPLSFLVNSWFPGMLDDFFQSLFLCALLLFWLCVYHGIRVQGERKCLTFYLPKFFIVGLLWLASVTLGIWQTFNELNDPMYQYRVDTGNFQGMKVFFMVVAAVYILYLLFLIVRACSELRHMPYVDLRLKFLTALTFVVLVISIVILYLRFGAQVLQDNFVAELSAHYQNSAEFLSFYGLLNFYLYTLAFVYSPSKNALYESQLKDNPAFSMLNDSDDDVIYGSDYEEMPLQNGQAIRAKCREESDSD